MTRRDLLRIPGVAAAASLASPAADTGVGSLYKEPDPAFRRVTLEISLKPFRSLEPAAVKCSL